MPANKIPTLDSTSKLKYTGSYTGEQVIVKLVGMFELVYDNSVPNNYSIFKAPNGGTWKLILASGEVVPLDPLDAPTLNAVADGEDTIDVSIGAVAGAEFYIIEVSEDGVNDWIEIYNAAVAGTFTHEYLNPSSQKFYRGYVTAEGSANSPYAEDDATTDAPVVPTQLATPSLSAVAAGSDAINVIIGTVADAENYIIRKSVDGTSGWVEVYNEAVAGVFNDTGLNPLEQWFYDAYVTAAGFITSLHATDNATTTDTPVLITANRFVDYDFKEGSGQRVFNKVGPNTVNPNLLGMSEQYLQSEGSFWTSDFLKTALDTLTPNYAANKDAVNQAYRIQTGAGAGVNGTYGTPLGLRLQGIALPAGATKMLVYVKSATGSAQTMRMAYDNGDLFSADLNVTTSWTQVEFSFTHAGGAKHLHFVANGSGGAALDILIDQLMIIPAAGSTVYVTPKLDICFGKYGTVESIDPTWNAVRGVNLDGTQFGYAISDEAIAPTGISVYVVAKAAANGTTQNYPIATAFNDNGFQVKWGLGGTADTTHTPSFKFSNSQLAYCKTLKLCDDEIHITSCVYDDVAGILYFYVDGILFSQRSATGLSATSIKRLLLSDTDEVMGRFFKGTIYKIVGFDVPHNLTEVVNETAALKAMMVSEGFTMAANANYLLTDGDSISDAGNSGIWPRILSRLYTTNLLSDNVGVVGSTLASGINSIQNRYASNLLKFNPVRNNVIVIFIGANDVAISGTIDAAAFVATYKTLCDNYRANGVKVVICTLLANTTLNAVANRNSINALLDAATPFWNQKVDLHLDPTIGTDAACTDISLFGDGVHPTPLCHGLISALVKPKVDLCLV